MKTDAAHGKHANVRIEKFNHLITGATGTIPEEAMMEALLSFGLPHWQVDGLIEDYAHYRRGEASAIASGVQDATGVPPHSFDDFARDYAPAFS